MPSATATADHVECNDSAARALLRADQMMLRMIRQTRIIDTLHTRLPKQPFRQCRRAAGRGPTCAARGSPRPFRKTQALKGLMVGPAVLRTPKTDSPTSLSIADDSPADTTTLSVQILGCRMDHQIRSQFEWALQCRRAETVVDRQQATAAIRDLGEAADIHHLGERVGGRLAEQKSGARTNRRYPRHRKVVERHIAGLDSESRQILVEEQRGAAEQAPRGDDMVAGFQQTHADCQDGGHSRGSRHTTFDRPRERPIAPRKPRLLGS
jgi:hypothetical protein